MPYHYTTESDVVYIYLIINLNEKSIFFYTGVEVHELWHKSILPMFIYIASFGTISIGIREITLTAWEDKITINHQ